MEKLLNGTSCHIKETISKSKIEKAIGRVILKTKTTCSHFTVRYKHWIEREFSFLRMRNLAVWTFYLQRFLKGILL